MTEKDLSKFWLLDEFSIRQLEERLEFEAWYDGNSFCPNVLCDPVDGACPPNAVCDINEGCIIE